MSGCPNYGHATRTPSNNLIGTAYIGEQYRVEPGDGKDEPWTSAANPDGSQFSSQGYLSRVHSSTQDHYPTIGRNQRPSSMTLDQDRDIQRQYGGPSHSFLQPGFIDPAQLSNSGASYDQSPSLRTFDDRYNWAETHNDPQVNPLAYVSCQRPGQLRATAVFRNGHEAACRGQYDQPSMVFADNYGVVERHVPTLATVNHLLIAPIQRPDNVFVPGVLKRQQGHEQQLDVYTDQLLGRLSTSTDDHLVHANLDVAPAPNPTSFYGPIGDRQQTVIQPPSFDTIRMQGSRAIGNINQITEQRIPSWYVTEDAPVVVEPDTSDSRPRYVEMVTPRVQEVDIEQEHVRQPTASRDQPPSFECAVADEYRCFLPCMVLLFQQLQHQVHWALWEGQSE